MTRLPRAASAPASSNGHGGLSDALSDPAAGPVRTCVGCRKRDLRSTVVRFVLAQAVPPLVAVDESRAAPGRGGWLHPERACLELAIRRGAFARALRVQGRCDVTAVEQWFAAAIRGEGSDDSTHEL